MEKRWAAQPADRRHAFGQQGLQGRQPALGGRGAELDQAAITGGELHLDNCPCQALDAVFAKLREMGVVIDDSPEGVLVRRGGELNCVDVTTLPYPGFPTDMQAQIMALMSVASGAGTVRETIFENRFMHVQELVRLGADIKVGVIIERSV